jgi:hypothetical protein
MKYICACVCSLYILFIFSFYAFCTLQSILTVVAAFDHYNLNFTVWQVTPFFALEFMIETLENELANEIIDFDVVFGNLPFIVLGWILLWCFVTTLSGFLIKN